ncbi:TlpA family protein disulfide reductase [Nocardiopsis ganjiahuensis]|uniref:TlpA family protein disulfide reductase n=1 Tax=Nocardiopsis ganjiahuensis TaxID=239984 RepID=UPI00034905FB|nr:redoxin family protein [Nocardiopsis ganjiahuensis]
MGILIAAVVVLTALTLFNLVLTMALVRRLRRLEDPGHGGAFPVFPDLEEVPAGRAVPEFTATTKDGVEVSSKKRLGDRAVYAFFDTSCGTCKKQLQPLVDFAKDAGLSPEQVIAFVGHEDPEADADAYTSVLEGHTTVVMQSLGDEVGQAFSPGGIPAIILADSGGVVVRSGVEVKNVAAAFLET